MSRQEVRTETLPQAEQQEAQQEAQPQVAEAAEAPPTIEVGITVPVGSSPGDTFYADWNGASTSLDPHAIPMISIYFISLFCVLISYFIVLRFLRSASYSCCSSRLFSWLSHYG